MAVPAKQAEGRWNVSAQGDLFASEASSLTIDSRFTTAKRTAIDSHSWIDVVPGWMSGSLLLCDQLATGEPWLQRDRRLFDTTFREPRLTAEYRSLCSAPKALMDAARVLSYHYEIQYDSLWLNLYRNGQDSTGWHRDRFSCRRSECIVPVLTLGASRRFVMKPRGGGSSVSFKPGSGDLIVMGGRCQEDWLHGVPKESGIAERRISVNFQSSVQADRATAPMRARPRVGPPQKTCYCAGTDSNQLPQRVWKKVCLGCVQDSL
jgi:alkylated DNA repair dioxygenase AlkB